MKKRPLRPKSPAKTSGAEGMCLRPDRDVPGIICGYPLPCPHHTVTIDTTSDPPELRVPISAAPVISRDSLEHLKCVGRTLAAEQDDT